LTGMGLATLTKDEQNYNKDPHMACMQVEGGIGRLEVIFDALMCPWGEEEDQQTSLVTSGQMKCESQSLKLESDFVVIKVEIVDKFKKCPSKKNEKSIVMLLFLTKNCSN